MPRERVGPPRRADGPARPPDATRWPPPRRRRAARRRRRVAARRATRTPTPPSTSAKSAAPTTGPSKLPKELVEELARVTTQAQQVWQRGPPGRRLRRLPAVARKGRRSEARRRPRPSATRTHPTTPCSTSTSRARRPPRSRTVFAALRPSWCRSSPPSRHSPRKPTARDPATATTRCELQKMFGQAAAAAIGFDFDGRPARRDRRTRSAAASAPATAGSPRATTRATSTRRSSASCTKPATASTSRGSTAEHFGTPLGSCCSLGIHESQSRLWENQVGRGRPFWEHFFPRARQTFPACAGRRVARRLLLRHQRRAAVVHPRRGRRGDVQPAHHPALRAGAGADDRRPDAAPTCRGPGTRSSSRCSA